MSRAPPVSAHRHLLVLDGTAMLFRSYYGGPDLRAPDGTPVGAVVGVAQRVARQLRDERGGHVAVVFDAGQHTFRNDLDPRYKANRGDPPDDLRPQFDLVVLAVEALGVATFRTRGFEADDLVATLARLARAQGLAARLATIDKDICQLVADSPPPVFVEDPQTGARLDERGVEERFGVLPRQLVDYQALVGDSTDNVLGVRGVGAKTAAALLQHFGTLDALYARLGEIAGLPVRGARTLAAKLEAGRDDATLARRLVALRDDVPLAVGDLADHTWWRGPHPDASGVFARIGFSGPLRGVGGTSSRAPS